MVPPSLGIGVARLSERWSTRRASTSQRIRVSIDTSRSKRMTGSVWPAAKTRVVTTGRHVEKNAAGPVLVCCAGSPATPGLDLPVWEVRPQTPTSSIREGVEVLSYGDGKIKVRIRTGFFALYGRDPSVLVSADAPAPPGSYFQIRRRFPLDLTLEAPFAFK